MKRYPSGGIKIFEYNKKSIKPLIKFPEKIIEIMFQIGIRFAADSSIV